MKGGLINLLMLLMRMVFDFDQPMIIAETGWKTYDLLNAINQTSFY
jgi:hypothetical protein